MMSEIDVMIDDAHSAVALDEASIALTTRR
jgi:hypothetical protein